MADAAMLRCGGIRGRLQPAVAENAVADGFAQVVVRIPVQRCRQRHAHRQQDDEQTGRYGERASERAKHPEKRVPQPETPERPKCWLAPRPSCGCRGHGPGPTPRCAILPRMPRRAIPLVACLLLLESVSTATIQRAPDATASLRATLPSLQKNLDQAVVRFWYPRVIDRTHGGYRVAFDANGTPTPDGSKMIVTQARMLWLFARLARAGYRVREMRDAATHGYQFLVHRMWDRQHGGYVWEVDESGTRVADGSKVIYGEAFALYALSE